MTTMTMDEIIVAKLTEASAAYYNTGEPVMSDHEFDELVDRLRMDYPGHPYLETIGAPVMGTVIQHEIPVGSQEKLKDQGEVDKWTVKVRAEMDDNAWSLPFVMQWKLDGITAVLYYKDGKLINAVTRGDGYKGEDITRNALHMRVSEKEEIYLPKELPEPFTGAIRGEVLLSKSLFEKHFAPLGHRNPRNTAAGKARKKTEEPELLKHLFIQAFDIVPSGKDESLTEQHRLAYLKKLGFEHVSTKVVISDSDLWSSYKEFEALRDGLDFEVDGVIVRANSLDVQRAMGTSSDLRPKGQRCIKFEAMSKTTYLESVEITIGHTGAQIPTGKLKPVGIGGVTVSSVLLNNWDEIERLDIAVGDKVEVIRAGDVIPKIIRVLERPANRETIEIPTKCICCEGDIVKDGAHHICPNVECTGREFRRLKSWVTKRNIKFLGDTLLEELYEYHDIRFPRDLYWLTEEYLSKVPRGNGIVGTGARHIMKELELSKTATLPQFLGSLAIRFLGRRQVEIMMKTCGLATLEDFLAVTVDELESKDGFSAGGSKATGIVEGIQRAREEIEGLLKADIVIEYTQPAASDGEAGKLSGKSFCFSGSLPSGMKRTEAQDKAESAGGEIKKSVSKNLDYLVIADPNSNSSKAKKARSLGVEIISEEEFEGML